MKKILVLIASPRKLGNCEIMAKEIARNVPEPHELHLLRLSDFSLAPCRGCYFCLFGEQTCVIQDDFPQVLRAIVEADALIVMAPTYFLGPNSSLKRLADRGIAFYPHAEKLWGKPAVGVGIAGIEGKEGYTLLGITSFLKILLADIKKTEMIYGALPGEIFMGETNRERAAVLGRSLFGDRITDPAPRCPLCGGDTFRFMGGNTVRCMLCSNQGSVSLTGSGISFDVPRSHHDLFLTREDALAHREWLIGMKSRFTDRKETLKKIVMDYRSEGRWITPEPQAEKTA